MVLNTGKIKRHTTINTKNTFRKQHYTARSKYRSTMKSVSHIETIQVKSKNAHQNSFFEEPHNHKNTMCLCSAIKPVTIICNLVGIFPVTAHNQNGECVFQESRPWLVYSMLVCVAYYVMFDRTTDLMEESKKRSFPELLTAINDVLYMLFVTVLTALNVMRYPRYVRALNHIMPIAKAAGLLCNSSLHTVRRIQYGIITILVALLVIQYTVLYWLDTTDSYATNFTYNIYIIRAMQNLPLMFYFLFMSLSSLFISLLSCFERLTINTLHFSPVHPLKDIDETNNERYFLGLVRYTVCKQQHLPSEMMLKMSSVEIMEYLRCVHEDISLAICDVNSCLNPQLLFHMVVELTVLIVHWYEVVIYTSYDFTTPFIGGLNILNWVFVLMHSFALFMFLKSSQQMKNMINGLTSFLLEYSTRVSTAEEHQQVRVFLDKVLMSRPMTASGVFNIDLGIAGPISANILTYVLVALQFDIPKND